MPGTVYITPILRHKNMRAIHNTNVILNRMLLLLASRLLGGKLDHLAFQVLCLLKSRRSNLENVDYFRARSQLLRGAMAEAKVMLQEELRYFPDNRRARLLLNELEDALPTTLAALDPDLTVIYPLIAPFTMLGIDRLNALVCAARRICEEDRPGNFVECGVAAGGSSVLLAWLIKKYSKRKRRLFAADSFEGLPAPGVLDTRGGKNAKSLGWGQGTCAAPLDSLLSLASQAGVDDIIQPIKGFFHQSLPRAKDKVGRIALLHLDGDWYESTMAILSHLYPLCEVGAYLQFDDYHYWEGCRLAVAEYQAQTGEQYDLQSIDSSGAAFWKAC